MFTEKGAAQNFWQSSHISVSQNRLDYSNSKNVHVNYNLQQQKKKKKKGEEMLRTVQITWSYLYMKKKKAHKSEGENMALSLKCIWLFAQLRYFFLQIFSRKLQHRRRAGDGASRS